ncbi:peptidoglycan/LPS O-acetylase OafA/YrhL [Paraburkholderia sp. CI2]|uniref:acyltransferase family protein n=1 Tax=Paraburkholderia sp. CI2 TaxID=2723093 RepID=UPI00160B0CBB|nr:acyltransferase [Paraburkholderia sp. CI2]MBB5467941.1 peptidoglycan/LPS O-acetylase OafA/YrhL [Paraburkholderia sp. CI2]
MTNAVVSVRPANARKNIEVFTSLRGIACLIVVMAHVWSILDWPRLFANDRSVLSSYRFIGGLFNASGAVQMFFVLSACVLAVSLSNEPTQQAPPVKKFYVRRFFRIYPALWASIVLTICLWHLIRSPQALDSGLYSAWGAWQAYPSPPTAKLIALSMLGLYVHLNGPLWTLRVELFYSLAFPVIYLLARNPRKRWALLACVSLLALLPIPREFCMHYALAFGLGAAIPFLPRAGDVPYRATATIALIALLFLQMPADRLGIDMKAAENIEMLVAFVAVYCLYHSGRSMQALEARPFAFIGDISYSVYVLHFPILFALTPLVVEGFGPTQVRAHPLASLLVLTVVALCTTIFVAALSRRYVERPGERLGRIFYAASKEQFSRGSTTGKSPSGASRRPSARE